MRRGFHSAEEVRMKGDAAYLLRYMAGADKRFIIPVYQRNYDWRNEHCRQLFDDLIKVIEKGRKSHFFGSIVAVNNPDGGHYELLVIDGQQRITTVSLLLLAIHNLIKSGEMRSENNKLQEKIFSEYLVDQWQPVDRQIKLKLVKHDSAAYERLFGEKEDYIRNSNLTINYLYFLDRIRNMKYTLDQLYDAVSRLEIIDIALNQDDNPQLIFESLNSTGLDLSEGDKIRNYILMGLSPALQEEYYTIYWNPIEIKTDYDVSSFIRDYLSVKQMETPAMKKIYVKFKEYVESQANGTKALLEELLIYARRYHIVLHGRSENEEIRSSINRLNRLETTVIRPFLLEVIRENEEGGISEQDFKNILLVIESYLLRRMICDLPTNSLNKIFLQLHNEIVKLENNTDNYLEKMKFILHNKKEKARFPADEEFAECLETKNIYSMQAKNKWYLFERLENGNSRETKDVCHKLEDGDYTIEHIMPQHLTPAWKKELGPDWAQIHGAWLHRLANLTLTAYNSSYSNLTFAEKRDMKNGFKDSGFVMNQKIARREKWTLDEIRERSRELRDKALTLWPYADTDYQPPQKPMDQCSLEDAEDLTNRVITGFRFKGAELACQSWVDMYQKVLHMLHQEDQSILNELADKRPEGVELAAHVSRRPEDFPQAGRIGDSLYVMTKNSTQYKISLLRRFFALYQEDPSSLTFYLKEEAKTASEEPSADLRFRYWAEAIPEIRRETGLFLNVNPTKANWIAGASGYNGISYNIVTNFDSARVELYIGTQDKALNKTVYRKLFEQKEAVEKEFGSPLEWAPMDEYIASRVYLQLDGVRLVNEEDWDRMTEFQAGQMKRLIGAVQERLREALKIQEI